MDIYQIWTKYNKPWSKFEIACFSVALIIIFICTSYCVYKKKINKIQATAILLMVVFLSIVFESTIFTRTVTVRQYKLQLFWSWREIILYHDIELLKEDLLNCILLLPLGVLLPVIAGHKLSWYKALEIGILVSAFIEVSQLVLMRGLFEWDDMIHNGLGCMAGCCVTNFMIGKLSKINIIANGKTRSIKKRTTKNYKPR